MGRCWQRAARCWAAAWVLWLHGLLAVRAGLCPQLGSIPSFCQALPKVCVDQSTYVMYDNRHNPRHELFTQLPTIRLDNVSIDYFGFGDLWGTKFAHPLQLVRPATGGEETRDLQHPQFSRCSVPMVLYVNHLYKYSHFFVNTVATLNVLQQTQALDKRLNLVIDSLGMQLEPFHQFLLAPFSSFAVTTLSHMSSRQPLETPEPFNPDGQHIRCFWQLLACQMGVGAGQQVPAGLAQPLWSTGQAILDHYRMKLPAIDPEFAEPSKMRVLIAARPRSSKLRALLNQEQVAQPLQMRRSISNPSSRRLHLLLALVRRRQLAEALPLLSAGCCCQVWSWCNKFQPPRGVTDWNGTACLLHEFGRDLLSDVAYASQADVLLGVHSDALLNAFTMRQQSSLVEIRPHGYNSSRHSRLRDLAASDGDSIFWWGVDIANRANSLAGALEQQQRGAPHTWPRERHTFIRLMALQYVFERIALTRTDLGRYQRFRERGETHINDLLARVGNTTQRHSRRMLQLQLPPTAQLQEQPPQEEQQERRPKMAADDGRPRRPGEQQPAGPLRRWRKWLVLRAGRMPGIPTAEYKKP